MFSDKIHTLNTAVRAEDEKLQSLNDKLEGFKEKLRRVSEAVCMLTSRSQRIEQQKRDHKALTQNILTDTVIYDSYATVKRRLPKWCKVTIDDKFGLLPQDKQKHKNREAIVIGYHDKLPGQPVQIKLGMKIAEGENKGNADPKALSVDHRSVSVKAVAKKHCEWKRKIRFRNTN